MRSGSRRFEAYGVYDTVDRNDVQLFALTQPPSSSHPPSAQSQPASTVGCNGVVALKLNFPASTDSFGRVTIYNIQLTGTLATQHTAAD